MQRRVLFIWLCVLIVGALPSAALAQDAPGDGPSVFLPLLAGNGAGGIDEGEGGGGPFDALLNQEQPLVSAEMLPGTNFLMLGAATDNAPHPLGAIQAQGQQLALQAQLQGKVSANARVYRVNKRHYIELEREGEDRIWTILGEFGTQIHPALGGTPGPLHNQLPRPNRVKDNTNIWVEDFNKAYYTNLLFSEGRGQATMRNYYIEQSSNRYAVNGIVEDWVKVPFNEAYYGSNYCGDIVCAQTWAFVQDSANTWYANQLAAGKTPAQIDAYLAQFDVWDRYDYNGNSNFNEPDGYIDHFQAVHAGSGEETGGGSQGTDAIWSHRWYAFFNNIGVTGPAFNLLGGVHVGGSSYWIGDYTVEPEDGGLGAFAHEFGHDLGLPDLYDTSGNTGGAENSVGFWSLYASGSYGSTGRARDGIGGKPVHMSAYEKLFLDWSNYITADYTQRGSVVLGPAEYNTRAAQQLVVLLPDKQVNFDVGAPYSGSYFYHSGFGNNLDHTMTRSVALPAGTITLNAKVRYQIEADWDYAYLTVNGTPIQTNLSSAINPNGQNFGQGITGSSSGLWVNLTADLTAYAGQTVTLGFRYWTDGAVSGQGLAVDEIAITWLATDGGESDPGWTYSGFQRTGGIIVGSFTHYYVAEYRQYVGYDEALRTGPYNRPDEVNKPNFVEHFPYQDGLLVWYLDNSFADNNVGDNCAAGRCGGLFLPVDSHPMLLLRPDNGQVWRPRVQAYDSTFALDKTDTICLTTPLAQQCYGGLNGNPLFDDTQKYWYPPNEANGNLGWASVPLPGYGVKLRVDSMAAGPGGFMAVRVNPR